MPRSVAMKLTGHKTEAVYRRYAIVCEADLTEGLMKLAVLEQSLRGKLELSHSSATISGQNPHITWEKMAEEPVSSKPVSVCNSLEQGKIQGISVVSERLAPV